jgi:hypothetical protein
LRGFVSEREINEEMMNLGGPVSSGVGESERASLGVLIEVQLRRVI